MCFVYVSEHGATLGITGGHLVIKHSDGSIDNIPKELVEGISIFGNSQMTAACIQYALERQIQISFFNKMGKYYGSLGSVNQNGDLFVLRQQEAFFENEFSLALARKVVYAKINNQMTVIKRYLRTTGRKNEFEDHLFKLRDCRRKIERCDSRKSIRGYEGLAARVYFDILKNIVKEEFRFSTRNRRPAYDPVNAMLNFGYSIVTKEIYGEISNRRLSPYIGFLHEQRNGCPSLALDMIEEWRAVIVDSTVLSLIQGHEITIDMFEMVDNRCSMNERAIKILIKKLEEKMHMCSSYLSYINKPVSYREGIWHQVDRLKKAITRRDYRLYAPIEMR